MSGNISIAPSILSADFTRLAEAIELIERGGADLIHVDVMDGHFVPNLTVGPPVVRSLKRVARVPLDVHLMMTDPLRYAGDFARAGAHVLTFHAEIGADDAALRAIAAGFRAQGVPQVGLALNPDTPLERALGVLDAVDLVLVMSVQPGFGGQRFRSEVLAKTRRLRELGYAGHVEMDGGLNAETIGACAAAGCDVFVSGSALFGERDMRATLSRFRRIAGEARGEASDVR